MQASVMVVEDEEAIRDAIVYALETERFDVMPVCDARSARAEAERNAFDCVVLDVLLPDGSGFDVCRDLRAAGDVPIVIVSARASEADRIVGLELGADDYLVKPFSVQELVARIRALLRRRELDRAGVQTRLRTGEVELDLVSRRVLVAGRPISLTRSEFDLLAIMTRSPGRVLERAELMSELWGSPFGGSGRACDTHVANLRRKIEDDPEEPRRLVTVRGVGYRLDP